MDRLVDSSESVFAVIILFAALLVMGLEFVVVDYSGRLIAFVTTTITIEITSRLQEVLQV